MIRSRGSRDVQPDIATADALAVVRLVKQPKTEVAVAQPMHKKQSEVEYSHRRGDLRPHRPIGWPGRLTGLPAREQGDAGDAGQRRRKSTGN